MTGIGVMLVVIGFLLIIGGFRMKPVDWLAWPYYIRFGGKVGLVGCAILALVVVF